MTTGLLLAALLTLPPQPSPDQATGSQRWFPISGECDRCAPPKSQGPSSGPLYSSTWKDLLLIGGATGLATGWTIPGPRGGLTRSPGAVWRGKKPLFIWGAVGAAALANKLKHGPEEPAPVTVASKRPAPPGFIDAGVRGWAGGQLSPKARYWSGRASYWTLGHLITQPLGLAASRPNRHDRINDWLIPLEAGVAAGLMTLSVKHIVHRTRPYAYNCEPLNPEEIEDDDARFSFYSGHTSIAFALAASTSHVASVRQWKRSGTLKALNYSLASATGVLRILADRHYLTDVLLGAATGWATGHFLAKWRAKAERPAATPDAEVSPMMSLSLPVRNGVVTAQFGHGFGFSVSMIR